MSPSHSAFHSPEPGVFPGGQPLADDLAIRAVTAARAQATRLAHHPQRVDTVWRERAARATRTLAATLGLDPLVIVAVPDHVRRYGLLGIPEVLLTVTVPTRVLPAAAATGTNYPANSAPEAADTTRYVFIPETGRTDAFLQLLPCPRCARPVPTRRILALVDLGRYLDPEVTHHGKADTEQFPADPAHEATCPLHLPRR
jgi:hypothetical protein